MFGTNPKRPPIKDHDGFSLDVVEIFPTIQGEGPFAGTPAIFIRLGGCNLACDFCDTEFEDYEGMELDDVLGHVAEHTNKERLIVITGGEPLRHHLEPLCSALTQQGYQVQIETNGTLYQELPNQVHVVCSPKNSSGSYTPLRPDVLASVHALKFIISKTHEGYQGIPGWCHEEGMPEIYLQPMDEQDEEKNKENQRHTQELAMRYGFRLSLQLHKILGIR